MNKQLTFLLSLTFLFLFTGCSVVFAGDFQDGMDAASHLELKISSGVLGNEK